MDPEAASGTLQQQPPADGDVTAPASSRDTLAARKYAVECKLKQRPADSAAMNSLVAEAKSLFNEMSADEVAQRAFGKMILEFIDINAKLSCEERDALNISILRSTSATPLYELRDFTYESNYKRLQAQLKSKLTSSFPGFDPITLGDIVFGLHADVKEHALLTSYASRLNVDMFNDARSTKNIAISGSTGVGKSHAGYFLANAFATAKKGFVVSLNMTLVADKLVEYNEPLKKLNKRPERLRAEPSAVTSLAVDGAAPSDAPAKDPAKAKRDEAKATDATILAEAGEPNYVERAAHATKCAEYFFSLFRHLVPNAAAEEDGSVERIAIVLDELGPYEAVFRGLIAASEEFRAMVRQHVGNPACDIVVIGIGTGLGPAAGSQSDSISSHPGLVECFVLTYSPEDGPAKAIIERTARVTGEFKALLLRHPALAMVRSNMRMLHAAINLCERIASGDEGGCSLTTEGDVDSHAFSLARYACAALLNNNGLKALGDARWAVSLFALGADLFRGRLVKAHSSLLQHGVTAGLLTDTAKTFSEIFAFGRLLMGHATRAVAMRSLGAFPFRSFETRQGGALGETIVGEFFRTGLRLHFAAPRDDEVRKSAALASRLPTDLDPTAPLVTTADSLYELLCGFSASFEATVPPELKVALSEIRLPQRASLGANWSLHAALGRPKSAANMYMKDPNLTPADLDSAATALFDFSSERVGALFRAVEQIQDGDVYWKALEAQCPPLEDAKAGDSFIIMNGYSASYADVIVVLPDVAILLVQDKHQVGAIKPGDVSHDLAKMGFAHTRHPTGARVKATAASVAATRALVERFKAKIVVPLWFNVGETVFSGDGANLPTDLVFELPKTTHPHFSAWRGPLVTVSESDRAPYPSPTQVGQPSRDIEAKHLLDEHKADLKKQRDEKKKTKKTKKKKTTKTTTKKMRVKIRMALPKVVPPETADDAAPEEEEEEDV